MFFQLLLLFIGQIGVKDIKLQPAVLGSLRHFVLYRIAGHQEERRNAFSDLVLRLFDEVLVDAVVKVVTRFLFIFRPNRHPTGLSAGSVPRFNMVLLLLQQY